MTMNPSSDDDPLRAKMDEEYAKKQRIMQQVVKKSFILNKEYEAKQKKRGPRGEETELDKLMQTIRQRAEEKERMKNAKFWDWEFWQYVIKNNIDMFSMTTIEMMSLLAAYPFLTIKTRIQAKHKLEDVAHILKNKAEKQSSYRGVSQQFLTVFMTNTLTFALYRHFDIALNQNEMTSQWSKLGKSIAAFTLADLCSTPFLVPLEARRTLLQINVEKVEFGQWTRAMYKAFVPCLIRNIMFRSTFMATFDVGMHWEKYKNKWLGISPKPSVFEKPNEKTPQQSYNRQLNSYMAATFIATTLSMPFDLVACKLITQQVPKYKGMSDTFKTVIREEGYGKLFISGYWARSAFFLINGILTMNLYPRFKSMTEEAFQD